MDIGIPKEKRPSEYRVGLSPAGVRMLANRGHICYVEHDAGLSVGFSDQEYEQAGARLVYSHHEAFARAALVLKFARPLDDELALLQRGAAVAGFLHLPSADQSKIDSLLEKEITTIAYEQIQTDGGARPVLRPLSEIGGRVAAQIAAHLLQNDAGGKGILLGGMPGVPPAEVVILGAGTAGASATRAFLGAGAQLTVLDTSTDALARIHDRFPSVVTLLSNRANILRTCSFADVVVAAAAAPGQAAPILITRETLKAMKPRALVIDLSIDQGGCLETSRPTSHDKPTFVEEGIIHYCVPNISSVVARTASHVFFNAAIPYIIELAEMGIDAAIQQNPALGRAVNTHQGRLVNLARLDAGKAV
ncbi:MAG: alanine dehydrogenase [Chloroflexi bacterium]|nr:alanine dehydrogenase [Chloroflexota bacterium]